MPCQSLSMTAFPFLLFWIYVQYSYANKRKSDFPGHGSFRKDSEDAMYLMSALDCVLLCRGIAKCSECKFDITNNTCRIRFFSHNNTRSRGSHISTETNAHPTIKGVILGGKTGERSRRKKEGKFKKQEVVGCGPPPLREGATVKMKVTKNGSRAVYACKNGHINIGGKTLFSSCDFNSSWSAVDISCNNLTTCAIVIGKRRLYYGDLAVTKSGLRCQRWDSQYPINHDYITTSQFAGPPGMGHESVTDAANYCRDPIGGDGQLYGKIWCYTLARDTRWEECHVTKCPVPV